MGKLIAENYRPEIEKTNIDLSKYDIIIFGTPTWYSNVSLPILTFLDSNDISGKEVTIFAAHAGGPGKILENFENYVKNVKFKKGILFKQSDVFANKIDNELDKWLKTLK